MSNESDLDHLYTNEEKRNLQINYKGKWIYPRSLLDMKETRTRLRELLENDKELKRAYCDNIAMAIYDRLNPIPKHIEQSREELGLPYIQPFNHTVKKHRDELAETILDIFITE